MDEISRNDSPAFAPTLHSILDRYRTATVARLDAVKALTGITLALAPEELFSQASEISLQAYFGERLDAYREADEQAAVIGEQIVAFVWAAAQGDPDVQAFLRPDI